MATVQIDEAELRQLRGATQLLDSLQNNPKTRRPFQNAVKVLHPDTITDEDRLADAPEVQALNSLTERFDKFLKSQEDSAADTALERGFNTLRTRDGFTAEGIESVKQLMVTRRLGDPEAAGALWEKLNPPKAITPNSLFQTNGFGFGSKTDDADLKLLFEDEDAYAEREFIKAMNEAA